jgi:hypothetical protein
VDALNRIEIIGNIRNYCDRFRREAKEIRKYRHNFNTGFTSFHPHPPLKQCFSTAGPSSYKKRIYQAAASRRLKTTAPKRTHPAVAGYSLVIIWRTEEEQGGGGGKEDKKGERSSIISCPKEGVTERFSPPLLKAIWPPEHSSSPFINHVVAPDWLASRSPGHPNSCFHHSDYPLL